MPPPNPYRGQLAAAVRAVGLTSSGTFSWLGRPAGPAEPAQGRFDGGAARARLAASLGERLYLSFYLQGHPVPLQNSWAPTPRDPHGTQFSSRLSTAHAGRGCVEAWEVVSVDRPHVIVRRGGLEVRVDARREMAGTAQLAAGRRAPVRLPNGFPSLYPGFYTVAGNSGFAFGEARGLVRLYWNLRPDGGIAFAGTVPAVLNRAGIPFQAKILDRRESFRRCDAAVLYLRKSGYGRAAGIVARTIHPGLAEHLKARVPAFTKPLAPGLGLAEDPRGDESFGEHRCRLVAEGLVRARAAGALSVGERLQVVAERFAAAGVDPEEPFLNPGSRDEYGFRQVRPRSRAVRPAPGGRSLAHSFLEVASSIGEALTRQALWHGDRCNWLGRAGSDRGDSRSRRVRLDPLGPDLYGGTSGVGLFLAELHRANPQRAFRRTALAAIRQAVTRIDEDPSCTPPGLYDGRIGIALAAARVGFLLEEQDPVSGAARVVDTCTPESIAGVDDGLMSGRAGAILGLLGLHGLLRQPLLLDRAVDVAEGLSRPAGGRGPGVRSDSRPDPEHPPLTGFSHGAAGIAYALLELGHRTGDGRFRRRAERAFAYERRWFDAAAMDWPDLRFVATHRGSGQRPRAFTTAWCHGAPGIALSRMRAHELLGDRSCLLEARTALRATRRSLEDALESETGSFCLCHGLAGNADVLLQARRAGGRGAFAESAGESPLEVRVGRFGMDRYATGNRWPLGAAGGDVPGLMLGLAGVGCFYLQLYDPTIPSPLLLSPRELAGETSPSAARGPVREPTAGSPRRPAAPFALTPARPA